jgi:two-component sensor histidine kinase
MALALNELATNATKYGALSEPGGRVVIEWQVREDDDGKAIEWQWRESGGPTVGPPKRTSFGTRLIRDKLAADFNGEVELAYPPEGVVCRLRGRVDAT